MQVIYPLSVIEPVQYTVLNFAETSRHSYGIFQQCLEVVWLTNSPGQKKR